MVIAEAPWLHTLGQIAGVILVLELTLALIITCALMVALAFGAHWLNVHVIPPLREYLPQAEQAMTVTERGSDSLVHGIAEFYGRRQAVETGLRVLLFGKNDAENFREEQRIYADEALHRIEPPAGGASLPGTGAPPGQINGNQHGIPDGRDEGNAR